ncbi:BsuBI/PstI family type II restriction endonuclease [Spirosoma pulveris]
MKTKMKIEDEYSEKRKHYNFKDSYQRIGLKQIEDVLKQIGKFNDDTRDAVWCLLNDELTSKFAKNDGYKLKDGATIAEIGSFVGILMRGKTKLDREGRDSWIKPLREIGAIEPLTFDPFKGFLSGHVKAKSPNSCYRLNADFVSLLQQFDTKNFDAALKVWISGDSIRERLEIQAAAEVASRALVEGNPHTNLIEKSIELYASHFLPGFISIYKDDADGDRISDEERSLMDKYGIKLELEDSFPDVILYNPTSSTLWFIEAVTSDGEVDEHKLTGLKRICLKSSKNFGGATTTYLTWKMFSARQQKHKNLADSSRVWILEDPQKEFIAEYYKNKSSS